MQRDVLTNKMRKTLNKLNEKKFEKHASNFLKVLS